MKINSELKLEGKRSLVGNWGLAIGACVIVWLLSAAFIEGNSDQATTSFESIMSILGLVLTGPLTYGLSNIFLRFNRSQNAMFKNLFDGFTYFLQNFVLHVLQLIFIFLWLLLLIIPGIIAILRYSMSYYRTTRTGKPLSVRCGMKVRSNKVYLQIYQLFDFFVANIRSFLVK